MYDEGVMYTQILNYKKKLNQNNTIWKRRALVKIKVVHIGGFKNRKTYVEYRPGANDGKQYQRIFISSSECHAALDLRIAWMYNLWRPNPCSYPRHQQEQGQQLKQKFKVIW